MTGLTLVLGGVRSGKSAFAEQLAVAAGPRVLYAATAAASDPEMVERIRRHRSRRPNTWGLLEESLDLAGALGRSDSGWDAVLIESVSGWLSNLLLRRLPPEGSLQAAAAGGSALEVAEAIEQEALAAVEALLAWQRTAGPVIAVSDEAGLSLVPPNPAGRVFQDLLGTVNQTLAAVSECVYLVVAGLPLQLKGPSQSPTVSAPGRRDDSLRR